VDIVDTDDKKTARLNIIRHILRTLNRPGADVAEPDPEVVFDADRAGERLT
jgi:hypothetical protein